MGTYKGNAGHLMQHWTLCELLDIAGNNDTPGLNYIDAHAMAPLAMVREKANRRFDIVRQRVQVCLPNPNFAYEHAWHHLEPMEPNVGYPNSAAFVREVWEGQVSMLLCETVEATAAALRIWAQDHAGVEIAEGDWRDRFAEGLPSPPNGSLTLVSFDPNVCSSHRKVKDRKKCNLYPEWIELALNSISGLECEILIQISTYSAQNNRQQAVIASVDAILVGGGVDRVAVVRYDGNMMSLVYARDVSWSESAELANLPDRFTEWLNG